MKSYLATFFKDLLLLRRDRAGLLVLFLMPTVLVLVVSLVQNNVLEATGQGTLRVLFIDQDHGEVGRTIRSRLHSAGAMSLVEEWDGRQITEAEARRAVASGDYQFGVVIPEGTTIAMKEGAALLARKALGGKMAAGEEEKTIGGPTSLHVFFDPAVQGVFRTAVNSSLRHVALGLETEQKARELATRLSALLAARTGAFWPGGGLVDPEKLTAALAGEELLEFDEQAASFGVNPQMPNAVQQNVPAWALFGMFFIVVPLSGALIRERQEGTLSRLLSLPVPYWALLAGKVSAYVTICMIQFGLMLLMGKFILPLFGTPVLELGSHFSALLLLALCASLAATGFGILVGTLSRSYEQASMLGAVSVVIAAALGGIMVPVYVMPEGMKVMSAFSPLAWGLEGFLEIFVRGGDLRAVSGSALSLLAFAAATMGAARAVFARRG